MKLSEKIQEALREQQEINLSDPAVQRRLAAQWGYVPAGAQPAPNFADAYQGAMEEAAIWKKRALEAEDLNRKFIAEINGPTHMGEPAQPTPSVPDGWKLVPSVPDDLVRGSARLLKRASGHLRWLKKDTYQWQCLNPKTRRAAELLHRDIDAMLAAAPEANQ